MIISKNEIEKFIDKYKKEAIEISLDIWNNPEASSNEFYASHIIKENLKKHNFRLKRSGNIETHIVASFGSKHAKKIVGILGEYDALEGLWIDNSKYQFGHGCGHNLLGSGSMLSAIVLSKLIKKYKLNLQVIYYGCPAEESGSGKVVMHQKGLFKNLDACFTWHPAAKNSITNDIWIGSKIIKINFLGKETHASMNANSGVNANNLMVKTINFLNTIKNINLSYIINPTKQNLAVIPNNASMDIAIRSFSKEEINAIYINIKQFLKNTFSENQFEIIEVENYPITRHDEFLQKIVYRNFKKFINYPNHSDEEYQLSKSILKNITSEQKLKNLTSMNIPLSWSNDIFNYEILHGEKLQYIFAPTDVGVVSRLVPTIQFQTICMPIGISVHTREATIFSENSIGIKGMILASKILVSSIIDYYNVT